VLDNSREASTVTQSVTPAPDEDEDGGGSSSSGLEGGAIAAIVVGSVFGLVLLAGLLFALVGLVCGGTHGSHAASEAAPLVGREFSANLADVEDVAVE